MSAKQSIVWVNGEYLTEGALPISASAPGLTIGLGVFDSLCSYEGKPFDYTKHYRRLANACQRLGFTLADEEEIYQALLGVIEKNGFQAGKCRLRITVLATQQHPLCIVSAAAYPQRAIYSSSVVADGKVNAYSPLAGIKSTCYALNYLELQKAQQQGADEAILLNTDGELCEGATSNIFIVRNGVVKTPPLSSGCLPGVARDTVLEFCAELGIPAIEETLALQDVLEADEVFLTSSLREVQAVTQLNGKELHSEEGNITAQLRKAYQNKVNHGSE